MKTCRVAQSARRRREAKYSQTCNEAGGRLRVSSHRRPKCKIGTSYCHSRLIQQLNLLRSEMLQLEASGIAGSAGVHPEHRASAANLSRLCSCI
jgi:hypothetical protein